MSLGQRDEKENEKMESERAWVESECDHVGPQRSLYKLAVTLRREHISYSRSLFYFLQIYTQKWLCWIIS